MGSRSLYIPCLFVGGIVFSLCWFFGLGVPTLELIGCRVGSGLGNNDLTKMSISLFR